MVYKILGIVYFVLLSALFSCGDDSPADYEPRCAGGCEYWEYCNFDIGKCELNQRDGFCKNDSDCYLEDSRNNKVCNKDTYSCEMEASNCEQGCYDWEQCIDSICELKQGFCYWDNDCSQDEYCNESDNKCMQIDTSCDLICESWEICKVYNEGNKACVVESSLKWNKLKLSDNQSIKMPYGFSTSAYDSRNETMVNYFSLNKETAPISSVIGKLNLSTGVEREVSLFFDGVSSFNNLCSDNMENCELITYNKEAKEFILLPIKSSFLIFFNYSNIIRKSVIFSNIPEFSKNLSTTSNSKGDMFYVYNNRIKESNNSELYSFSVKDMTWKLLLSYLPNVSNNCLIENKGIIYSFGGILSYNNEENKNYISKYYKMNSITSKFNSYDMPKEFNERANIACSYDSKRDLVFLYGGSNIIDKDNELENKYYSDLWSFNLKTNEWKKILEISDVGSFLPPDEEGNRIFNGDIDYPVFGKNKSRMIYDEIKDRLILLGEIPPEKGIYLYTIELSK